MAKGFYQSISCWDNCRNNLGVVLTVATASWDTVMFVILHATLFDIYTPFYWCLTLCNENMIFDPQNKKMTPPPPSKPPSIGAWPLVMKIWNLTPKTKKKWPPSPCNPLLLVLDPFYIKILIWPLYLGAWPFAMKVWNLTPLSWSLIPFYWTYGIWPPCHGTWFFVIKILNMTPISWCLTLSYESCFDMVQFKKILSPVVDALTPKTL